MLVYPRVLVTEQVEFTSDFRAHQLREAPELVPVTVEYLDFFVWLRLVVLVAKICFDRFEPILFGASNFGAIDDGSLGHNAHGKQ